MSSLDVIIPCYNYGRFLRRCVDSVLIDPPGDLRVLIIDDASTDDSALIARAIAAGDRRVEVLEHQQNRGHIATYNEGIDWVSADYMLLLSADDFVARGALGRAVCLMETNPNVGFVHGRHVEFIEQDGELIQVRCDRGRYIPVATESEPPTTLNSTEAPSTVIAGIDFIRSCCERVTNPVGTVTAVMRGPLQKRLGGYRPELPHSGDYEMWLRFAAYADVGELHSVQGFTRIHGRNMRTQYFEHGMVGDFRQRHAAFSMFFADAARQLPGGAGLSDLAFRHLAEEVFWESCRAFEAGALEQSRQLRDYARTIWPGIARSSSWHKLSMKRALGPRVWRAVSRRAVGMGLLQPTS